MRVAQLGLGDFDLGDGRRFERTSGFSVQGAGPDAAFAAHVTTCIDNGNGANQ
jgi:hypothetical protein